MSHIDEGALHAYLDGALGEYPPAEAERIREHLDACAECARRLEAERTIRTSAHAILDLAAPEVELPSFEDLRAYVERTRPKGGAISVHAYRMRLAASVVLALGTGWMLRGGLPGAPMSAGDASMEAMAPAESAPDADVAFDQTAPTSVAASLDADVAAGSGAGASSGSVSGQVATRTAGARADMLVDAATERQEIGAARSAVAEIRALPEAEIRSAPAAELVAAAEPFAAGAMKQGASMADAATVEDRAAESLVVEDPVVGVLGAEEMAAGAPTSAEPEAPVEADRFADAVVTTTSLDESVAVAANDVPAAPAAADTSAGEASTADPDEEGPGRERAAGPPVTSALERAGLAARRAAPGDDVPVSDEPAMAVPGLEVVSVTSLGEGTAPHGTLVVQRTEDGSPFQIYHLLPEVGRDVVPRPPAGLNEVSVLAEGGWIVLQGAGSVDELEALLESLFPAG